MITKRELLAAAAGLGALQFATNAFADQRLEVSDSALPDALKIYYSSLTDLCQSNGFQPGDKLALNNTIMSFDISQDTPYFNEGLYRRFVDRVYLKSPERFAPVNQADRFSVVYERLLTAVSDQVDQRHPEITAKIKELDDVIVKETKKLTALITTLEGQWNAVAAARGLKEGDASYEIEQIKYMETIKYADQVNAIGDRIGALLMRKEQVRRSVYTPSENMLLEAMSEMLASKKIARPRRPQYERTVPGVNELTFADPRKNPENICDISLSAYPMGDLVNFLKVKGVKEIGIDKSKSYHDEHEKHWSGGGGGSISFCGVSIGGSAGGGGSSKVITDSKQVDSIKLTFANIDEVLIDRGEWYNPALFANEDLAPLFLKYPDYDRLRYAAVSMIIGRGLTLTLTSSSTFDKSTWTRSNINGGGGVSFLGFGFGASGSSSQNSYTVDVSADGKTVTFKDDDQLARALAVRLTECAPERPKPTSGGAFLGTKKPITSQSRFVSNAQLEAYKSGKITYNELMSNR